MPWTVAVSSIFALVLLSFAEADFFTSLADLQTLVETEAEVTRTLETYLKNEEIRLNKIKWHYSRYKSLREAATSDKEGFLANPLNAFLLVKSLTSDWNATTGLIEGRNKGVGSVKKHFLRFPIEDDLKGAARALVRLQRTYQLDTAALARGEIQGTRRAQELSAGDCFEVGKQAYQAADYDSTLKWMEESDRRNQAEEIRTVTRKDILEYLAYSVYMRGNVSRALKLTEELLSIDPFHTKAPGNIDVMRTRLEEREEGREEFYAPPPAPYTINTEEVHDTYERLCRGDRLMSLAEESMLRCYYTTHGDPYFTLRPCPMEEVSRDPLIVMHHDVIRESEVQRIKQLARPKLKRAVVQNFTSGEQVTAEFRTSKSSWITEDDFTRGLDRRMSSLTGLDTATSEPMHVLNYGIGGHYEPHLDYAEEENHVFSHVGNRIATWIFYLTDVDAGGATVFPRAGVSVKPRKGSASFWYNLHPDGTGDERTLHAACPVLVGYKWVANKWFHEKGNEFRRPCSLNPNT